MINGGLSGEHDMDEADIERVAARVAEKLMDPANLEELSRAIARHLRLLAVQYDADIAMLGRRLDGGHY